MVLSFQLETCARLSALPRGPVPPGTHARIITAHGGPGVPGPLAWRWRLIRSGPDLEYQPRHRPPDTLHDHSDTPAVRDPPDALSSLSGLVGSCSLPARSLSSRSPWRY